MTDDPLQRPTAKQLLEHRFVKNARSTGFLNELLARLQSAQLANTRADAGHTTDDDLEADFATKASAWAFEADSTYHPTARTDHLPTEEDYESASDMPTSSSATLRTAPDFGRTLRPGRLEALEGQVDQDGSFGLEAMLDVLEHVRRERLADLGLQTAVHRLTEVFEEVALLDDRIIDDLARVVAQRYAARS